MKKRTVITTEKREVWVIRETIEEPMVESDNSVDAEKAIDVPCQPLEAEDLEKEPD